MRLLRALLALLTAAGAAGQSAALWETRTPLPIAVSETSAAALDGRLYLAGGITPDGRRSRRLFVYDPAADSWTERAPLPYEQGVDHCNLAAMGGKLYFLGGIRLGRGFLTNETLEYDPGADRWARVSRMAVPRGASGVAAIGGKIYVAGGEAAAESPRELEAFDPATRRWERLPGLPEPRTRLTAQAVGGKMYAIGGRASGTGDVRGEVFAYDPGARTWTRKSPMPAPRASAGSAVIDGRILVFGGEGAAGISAEVQEYDPATDRWVVREPMPTARRGLAGTALDWQGLVRAHLIGGGVGAGFTATSVHEVYAQGPSEAPLFTSAAVVDAAAFRPELAPGSIVSLFGEGLAPAETAASALPLPTRLAGVEVLIDGRPAPLFFVGPGQVNLQLPFDAVGSVEMLVRNNGVESARVDVPVSAAAPAIFTLDQSGSGQAAALVAGTGLVAGAGGRAVRRGEALEIFLTGLGAVSDPPPPGAAALASPLSYARVTPIVLLGGAEQEVLFAGLSPGFAGVYQINVVVAEATPLGPDVALEVVTAGAASNRPTVAVGR